jgi:hypothetical protein
MFLYHGVHPHMVGDVIMPLNDMKDAHPELYKEYAKKYDYEWRGNLMEKRIEPLNCLWNDVVFLLPVHPAEIRDARRSLGLRWNTTKFFVVPSEILQPELAAIYSYEGRWQNEQQYTPYTEEGLRAHSTLSERTVDIWAWLTKHRGGLRVTYDRVTHIFYKGHIPWRDLSILEV